jgi:hypothetical protein
VTRPVTVTQVVGHVCWGAGTVVTTVTTGGVTVVVTMTVTTGATTEVVIVDVCVDPEMAVGHKVGRTYIVDPLLDIGEQPKKHTAKLVIEGLNGAVLTTVVVPIALVSVE